MGLEGYYENLKKEYAEKNPISGKAFEKAKLYLAGGETRTVSYYPPFPLTIESGKGATITDVDGNRYYDFLNNYTSLIHGHANEKIANAICDVAKRGTAAPAGIEEQVKLAELLVERVPCVEKVRFCNSGTEATLFATRAAKVYTKKNGIVKMLGGYHGTTDMMEYNVSPDTLDYEKPENNLIPRPDIPGVSEKIADEMFIIPYNDIDTAKKVIEEHAKEIAAVIVEPFLGAGGVIPAKKEFLQALRDITKANDVLLIYDEVQGLRLSEGGAQKKYGVIPDIAAFGKIIGGGLPVGAVGGRKDIMDVFNSTSKVHVTQSGTFNGNRATMAAGYAAMIQYKQCDCDRLEKLADMAKKGMVAAFDKTGIEGCVTQSGSLLNYHFLKNEPANYTEVTLENKDLCKIVHLEMLKRGFFIAPRGLMALSTPMDERIIEDFCLAFYDSLAAIAKTL